MRRPNALPSAALAALAALALAAPPTKAQNEPETRVAPAGDFPHDDFGRAARVVTTTRDPVLGATIVTFSSGARLIVKPTRFSPGRVTVIAAFGGGRSGVPQELVHALWATTLFPLGGTRHLSYEDLEAWQKRSGHPVNVTMVATASAFQLKGEVPSSELGSELALLTAYAREPGFRPEMAARIVSIGPKLAAQIESDPSAMLTRAVQHRLVGARYQELPERADLAATTGEELSAILGQAFAMAPDIVIVGDIDVDAAVRAVAVTLAAGDTRPSPVDGVPAAAIPMPRPARSDLSQADISGLVKVGLYWRLPDDRSDRRAVQAARVAAAMLEARLPQLALAGRIATVAPMARAVAPFDLTGASYLGVVSDVGEGDVSGVRGRLKRAMKDLAAGRFTARELAQANHVVAVELGAEGESNDWWARRLGVVLREPEARVALRAGMVQHAVDRSEIRGFFRKMVRDVAPIEIVGKDAGTGKVAGKIQ